MDIVDNPAAELKGPVEALPVEDGTFDVVLCNQVLEHCDDPAQAVRELRRVTAPGGRVLASTHGVQVYHPSPNDLWRWTHAGLERLFRDNGDWAALEVRPGAGTTACLGMLLTHYIELLAGRARLRPAARPLVAAINAVAEAIDRARRLAARAAAGHDLRQLPRRRRGGRRERKALVTGGGGFIGSNLVRGAARARRRRCACSTTSRPATARNLAGLEDDVEIVEGELRSYERVHNAVRGVEVVFHQGALPSVPRSVQDPLTSSAVNVEGTLNVLLAARDEGVRRVVFASSSSVYGNAGTLPRAETQRPTRSRRTRSRSSPPSATASASAASTGSRRSRSATSTSSGRGRTRPRSTRPSCRASSRAIARGEPVHDLRRRRRSRATSPTSRTSSRRTCWPADAEGRERRRPQHRDRPPASVNELADAIGDDRSASRSRSEYLPVRDGRRPRLVGRRRRGARRARLGAARSASRRACGSPPRPLR